MTLFMIYLAISKKKIPHKLWITEKRTYVKKLKFPDFKWFCCQYPLINYLDIHPENRREPLLFNQETLVQLQEVLLYQLWDHLMGFQIKQR